MQTIDFTKIGNLIRTTITDGVDVPDLFPNSFVFQFDGTGDLNITITVGLNQKLYLLFPITSCSFNSEFAEDYDDAVSLIGGVFYTPIVPNLSQVLNEGTSAEGSGIFNLGNVQINKGSFITMTSPNDSAWIIQVDDEGVLTVTPD